MPKSLFYVGIVCCVFLAVSAASSLTQELEGTPVSFVAQTPELEPTVRRCGRCGWSFETPRSESRRTPQLSLSHRGASKR